MKCSSEQGVSAMQPRINTPYNANSDIAFTKFIIIVLVVVGILAICFGIYDFVVRVRDAAQITQSSEPAVLPPLAELEVGSRHLLDIDKNKKIQVNVSEKQYLIEYWNLDSGYHIVYRADRDTLRITWVDIRSATEGAVLPQVILGYERDVPIPLEVVIMRLDKGWPPSLLVP